MVPCPGCERIWRAPPSAASRSAIPCRPVPYRVVAVSNPVLLSVTVNRRLSSEQDKPTFARDALAYLAMFLQRFQGAEIHRRLGVLRVPPDAVRVDLNLQGGLARLGLQRRDQALVGQQRRGDAAGQNPQVVERGAYAVLHHGHEFRDGGRIVGGFLQQTEVNRERDELLLRPVVQVPFDLLPFGFLR